MIRDAWVVGRHECKAIFSSLLPSPGAILTYVLALVLFGIVAPIGLVSGWINGSAYLFLWFWLAWLIVAGPTSDSFAGERERHTLNTLFASRLPCSSILTGKIAAVFVYGLALITIAMGGSAVDAYFSGPAWLLLPNSPSLVLVVAVLSPLVVLLATVSGSLISISARTARQAHQATIIVVPAALFASLALARLFRFATPSAYNGLTECVFSHICNPLALPAAAIVMLALIVAGILLASFRLQRLRVVPA